MDSLANPSVQHGVSIALAAIAAAALLTFVATAFGARRAKVAAKRVFFRRAAVVTAFVAIAAGAAFALLSTPVETDTPLPAGASPGDAGADADVISPTRVSSAKLPALSLDAPAGWRLDLDPVAHKLTATSGGTRLLISTAILTEVVDAGALLGQLAERQRALGFDVGDTFPDRLGDLPATGFLAKAGTRSVCAWMVKRDVHLASSVICASDGKPPAREACRAPLSALRWRAPAH